MSRPSARIARTLWEAVIIGPAVILALAWIAIVMVGFVDNSLVDRVRPEIDRVMSLLLIACVCSFGLGIVGFAVTRGRHLSD